MGTKRTEQKRAYNNTHYGIIKVYLPITQKERAKTRADTLDLSLSSYVKQLIAVDLAREPFFLADNPRTLLDCYPDSPTLAEVYGII